MKKQRWMVLIATVIAAPLAAQEYQTATPNKAVITSMGVRYIAPKCAVKTGHFLVSSAATYFKGSFDAKDAAGKADQLVQANKVSQRAIIEMKQDQNGGAWYWLGRTFLQQGDVPGADSALRHAEKLMPDCAEEIKSFRRVAWGAVIGPAVELLKMNKTDSAIAMFRVANMLSDESPTAFFNMAVAFSETQTDSAIHYFRVAQSKAAANKNSKNELMAATGNLVSLYQRKGDDASALSEARKLATLTGNDADSKRLLYGVLVRSKDAALQAEAKAIEAELSAAAEKDGTITTYELVRSGVAAFDQKEYERAASYFEKAYAKEPWRRDILLNVINTYFALKDYTKMLSGLAIEMTAEPLSEDYLKLQIRALQIMNSDTGKLNRAAIVWSALPVGLYIEPLVPQKEGAKMVIEASGREASDEKGKIIPPREVTLVLEFLDEKGAVVASKDFTIAALPDGAKQTFTVEVAGKGIVDFRYREKKP